MNEKSNILNTDEDLGIEIRYDHLYKIVIIGDTGVGKTALLSKYLKGVFPTSPLSTIATEFATKIIQIKEGGYIKAQIWDTAGQEKYKSITFHHYRKSVGGLILYDITKKSSFDNVKSWLEDLQKLGEKGCIIALVGNKLDLVEKNEKRREVTKKEAQKFADDMHMLFFETSAYNGTNISDVFEELLQTIYTERRKIPELKERDNLLQSQNLINLNKQNANQYNDNSVLNSCEC